MSVDFTTLIEKRNLKIGVPIMGGLIVVITVIVINLLLNPFHTNKGIILMLFVFVVSALLGGIDDVLNIYGIDRKPPRALSRTFKLIKVHKSLRKRIFLVLSIPWEIYKRFFFVLGSNPGKGIQAHEKILVQSIAGIALGVGLYSFSSRVSPGLLNIPILNIPLDIGILIIPFALIALLLMTNAVNFADGMDGLAANMLIASFFGFLIISLDKSDIRTTVLLSTVIGSLMTYLYFNIPPARFQMGDVGSLSLGALLAAVGFILGEPLLLLIISFPFVATLLSVIVQGLGRRLLGKRVLAMAPMHYHFQMQYEWSEEKIVMRFTLFSYFCMIVGLFVYFL
jgi:phospho-N-acetylmuramoyl-pentapeptide-transferase